MNSSNSYIFMFFMLFSFVFSSAQVTLNIISLPAETPMDESIYVAGSFNNWNPKDPNYKLQKINGIWTIEIPEASGEVAFKFTRGDWSKVEGDEHSNPMANRTFSFTGKPQSFDFEILSWEKPSKSLTSTTTWNVHLIQEKFYFSALDRYKNIWVYLPPDYHTSSKKYPVIYMHDGQNIFNDLTSFSGEWKVDETLNKLFEQGDYGAIVIGIENGEEHRLNEYSPWKNEKYGGGEGEDYILFIKNELKPYVDLNFRTKAEAEFTALIGSSMGGLISTYGGLSFPLTFGKIGAMSPSYWFALEDLINFIATKQQDFTNLKVYFNGSKNESSPLEELILSVKNAWLEKGLSEKNTQVKIDDYGGHNETYWAGEFEEIYLWLFHE